MSVASDEINFLVYRYLQESGFGHSAFVFGMESNIANSNIQSSLVPPAALCTLLIKGLCYIQAEILIHDDGTIVEALPSEALSLIDAVTPDLVLQRRKAILERLEQESKAQQACHIPNDAATPMSTTTEQQRTISGDGSTQGDECKTTASCLSVQLVSSAPTTTPNTGGVVAHHTNESMSADSPKPVLSDAITGNGSRRTSMETDTTQPIPQGAQPGNLPGMRGSTPVTVSNHDDDMTVLSPGNEGDLDVVPITPPGDDMDTSSITSYDREERKKPRPGSPFSKMDEQPVAGPSLTQAGPTPLSSNPALLVPNGPLQQPPDSQMQPISPLDKQSPQNSAFQSALPQGSSVTHTPTTGTQNSPLPNPAAAAHAAGVSLPMGSVLNQPCGPLHTSLVVPSAGSKGSSPLHTGPLGVPIAGPGSNSSISTVEMRVTDPLGQSTAPGVSSGSAVPTQNGPTSLIGAVKAPSLRTVNGPVSGPSVGVVPGTNLKNALNGLKQHGMPNKKYLKGLKESSSNNAAPGRNVEHIHHHHHIYYKPNGEPKALSPNSNLKSSPESISSFRKHHIESTLNPNSISGSRHSSANASPSYHQSQLEIKSQTLKGHELEVFICAWNPSQDLLVSGSGDSTARIWDLRPDGTGKQTILKHCVGPSTSGNEQSNQRDVCAVDWTSDGQKLASGSYDGHARIWDTKGDLKTVCGSHNGPIFALKWNPGGNKLVSAGVDRSCIVWDPLTGKPVQTFNTPSAPSLDVDWKDDTTFASCSTDQKIRICRIGVDEPVRTFEGHTNEVNAIRWNPCGSLLASCSDDNYLKIWTMDGLAHDLHAHNREVYHIKWAPAGPGSRNPNAQSLIASGSFDGTVKIWDPIAGKPLHHLQGHTESVYSVSFSPDTRILASGAFDGYTNMWDVRSGLKISQFKIQSGGIYDVSWSSSGNRLAIAGSNNQITVLDIRRLSQGSPVVEFKN